MATIYGTNGSDVRDGTVDDDFIYGYPNGGDPLLDTGSDTLNGLDGNDTLDGGGAADTLNGGNGNDTLIGTAGDDDILDGGSGIDTVVYSGLIGLTVNLQTGRVDQGTARDTLIAIESITGTSVRDSMAGNSFNNTFRGEGGDDSLGGAAGDDFLYGGDGNDHLTGGSGADHLNGGNGTDRAIYTLSSMGVVVNLSIGIGRGGDARGDTFVSIEEVFGSAFNDTITGNDADNVLTGGLGGDDVIAGNGGNDMIFGAGSDILDGGEGDDIIQGGLLADEIYGGLGSDTSDYSDSSEAITVNLATGFTWGGTAMGDYMLGIENLIGSSAGDALTGDIQANILSGRQGSDVLDGGDGADVLDGGIGVDTADYTLSSAGVVAGVHVGAVNAGGFAQGDMLADIENIIGSSFNDMLTGNSAMNTLTGGEGNDSLNAGNNDDVLLGGEGNDTLIGGNGADTIDGGNGMDMASYVNAGGRILADLDTLTVTFSGNGAGDTLISIEGIVGSTLNDFIDGNSAAGDRLDGFNGDDTIDGRGGDDYLLGGNGNDILEGGAGNDGLFGGAGLDLFAYGSSDFGLDTIYSWENGQDLIDFSDLNITFADLTVQQVGAHTVIWLTGNISDAITLNAIGSATIDASDFVF